MARIAPLEEPFTPPVGDQLSRMMPPGVPPIGLFRTFVKNLPMTEGLGGWGSYYLGPSLSLSVRNRELVIDRVCARCGCEYEWGVHILFFADGAGLSDAQITSVTHGDAADGCWTDESDRLIIEAVDALHDTADIDDSLWDRLAAAFTEPELLDLLLLTGWYHGISYAARAARVDLEPGTPRFADVTT